MERKDRDKRVRVFPQIQKGRPLIVVLVVRKLLDHFCKDMDEMKATLPLRTKKKLKIDSNLLLILRLLVCYD